MENYRLGQKDTFAAPALKERSSHEVERKYTADRFLFAWLQSPGVYPEAVSDGLPTYGAVWHFWSTFSASLQIE